MDIVLLPCPNLRRHPMRSVLKPCHPLAVAVGASLLSACASAPPANVPACTGACTTHTAGYEWAQRADLQDARVCDRYPSPFADGCRDGVEDRNQLRPGQRGF